MSKDIKGYTRFVGGIADFDREGIQDSYAFGRSVDYRTDPQSLTVLPQTIKESGNTVTDLIKWGESVSTNLYFYGNTGNFYKRASGRTYSLLRTVANSHGNGLSYFAEDDFIYYTSDKVIGRYGPFSSPSPQFVDDFLGAAGGVPLNTNSLDLESSSSQYASRADTASLSVTGNLSIDAQIKPESLPAAGATMALVSKWDESGVTRSYKFEIAGVSGYFGDGSDGALTISSNTTDAPIDSACTGTSGATTLSATNASFAAGQIIYIHYTRGSGAGTWMRNKIVSYTSGTITLDTPLNADYAGASQVLVLKQYTTVTVNAGVTWTAKAWNGTVGGILGFVGSTGLTLNGGVSVAGKGFRGGTGVVGANLTGKQGEGTAGDRNAVSVANNGNGGGGGAGQANNSGAAGGGHATAGQNGDANYGGQSIGGSASGTTDLTTLTFGGGGGSGGTEADGTATSGNGGPGGGIFLPWCVDITINPSTGSINLNGADGQAGQGPESAGGGAGAGGACLGKCQTGSLGSSLIVSSGGTGGNGMAGGGLGGNGASGRIHFDYLTSLSGSTSPALNSTQDDSLASVVNGYQLRLMLSANGTTTESYSKTANVVVGNWQEVGVAWQASTSTATFYLNAASIGTATGAFTSISDNGSTFNLGMYKNGTATPTAFYDGLIDEVRVFNVVRSVSDFFNGSNQQILTTTAGLVAYYKLNSSYADATANANNLTATNAPVFSSDVPYPSPTSRADIDQQATTGGNTYTPPTSISEGAADRKEFTPGKDPQKSVAFLIASVGTGNWTVTVHDQYNNTIASVTVANASLNTGYYEFTYTSLWSPLTNFTNVYHWHITSTVADGTVTTGSASDLTTVAFRSYFQFLMTETDWHPIARFLQFLLFGNGRYVAKLEATLYEPNKLVLEAGYHVRCFGYWREFIAIGCVKGTDITANDSGRIYFWDGIAPTFNFYIDVPEGGINALFGSKGKLYVVAGYQGTLLEYLGGDSADKIKQTPKITPNNSLEIYPAALNMWKTLLRIGTAGAGNSTLVQKGIYTWGAYNKRYEESLSYDYPLSTATLTGATTKIGMVMPFQQELLMSWQDNTAFGVDYINDSNTPFPTATVEFLIKDDGDIYKEKRANTLVVMFDPLTTSQNIVLKYQVNNPGTWTSSQDTPAVGDVSAQIEIPDGRYFEIQCAVDITSTATSPLIQGVGFEVDLGQGETRLG